MTPAHPATPPASGGLWPSNGRAGDQKAPLAGGAHGRGTHDRVGAWIFDLDDTLLAHREAVEAGITEYRRALGGAIAAADDHAEAARWHDLEEEHYHRYLAGELDFEGQRRERARGFVAPVGIVLDDEAASAWFDAYFGHYIAAWRLHDDVIPMLDRIAAADPGALLAIITNGELAFQTRKVVAVGLHARIPVIVASGEVGVTKPDATIFRIACDRLGVTPDEAVYVGDRLRTDAIGARSAGLAGVWIDRRGEATTAQRAEAAAAGVHVVRSLAELA